ncbi:MAG: D-2-hydroxyacid dehydrogenase [Gemmatimonadaceae bacterium]|nr:D-2-hydroxyacid dehydrogenase [Gemmatimonadaceae bacterium]
MASIPEQPPRRIVIGSYPFDENVALLHTARPELEVRGAAPANVTAADLAWADTYVGFRMPPRAGPTMGSVRWVHCTGAGVDGWLTPPGLPPAILLTHTSESFGPMIAEWVAARILAFQQQLVDLARAQSAKQWTQRDIPRLAGTRALVVGTGDIGGHVARLLSALGVRVTGASRSGAPAGPFFESVHRAAELPGLAGAADWIVLAVPGTPETHGMFSREVFAACRGAVLLNVGRGSVLDESAIPDALARGWLRGAALDVFEVEPLPPASPLWADPRVMVSPHISGRTTAQGVATGFMECLADIEAGRRPRLAVDPARGY